MRILCHLKMIFCRVLLPVLWVLAKATCSWGSHFLFQWCCFTSWDKWNDGSIPGCLTWLLNFFWERNRRETPVRNTSTGRPLCFMEPRVLLHRFYQNRFSIWNFCNAAFFHISTISMLANIRNRIRVILKFEPRDVQSASVQSREHVHMNLNSRP